MKRKAVVTVLVLVIVMLFSQFAFADGLSIVKTIPSDGESGKQPANLAVKIVFSEDMSDTANDAVNSKLVTITDPEGNAQAFTLVHHEKYPDELWFVLEDELVTNTTYTVTVQSGIVSTSGAVLANDQEFTFTTRNTKTDSRISLVLTVVMMVAMIVVTTKTAQKQAEGDAAKSKKTAAPEKVAQSDPYRLSREQGISVDEAKALIAKEKEKNEKKNLSTARARAKYEAEMAAREAEIEKRVKERHDASVYKVKTKGSLKEHGKQLPKAIVKKLAKKKKAAKK